MASLFQPTLDKIKEAVENVMNSQLAKGEQNGEGNGGIDECDENGDGGR